MQSSRSGSQGSDDNSNREWDKTVATITSRKAWEDFLFRTPCLKQAYLMGTGCGALVLAHKLRTHRAFNPAFNSAFFTFLVVFPASFVICATEVNRKHDMVRNAFRKNNPNIKEAERGK